MGATAHRHWWFHMALLLAGSCPFRAPLRAAAHAAHAGTHAGTHAGADTSTGRCGQRARVQSTAPGPPTVSSKLQSVINGAPNGSTIVFKAGGRYNLGTSLVVGGRKNLTLDGNGPNSTSPPRTRTTWPRRASRS